MSWAYAIIASGLVGMIIETIRAHQKRLAEIQTELDAVERSITRNSDALIKLEEEGEAIRHRLPDLLREKEAMKDEVTMKKQELEELEERYSRRHIGGSPLDL
jgi:predicted  nucleic acid-binding Zn-ribbon protein